MVISQWLLQQKKSVAVVEVSNHLCRWHLVKDVTTNLAGHVTELNLKQAVVIVYDSLDPISGSVATSHIANKMTMQTMVKQQTTNNPKVDFDNPIREWTKGSRVMNFIDTPAKRMVTTGIFAHQFIRSHENLRPKASSS
jgi:hypothetical protein